MNTESSAKNAEQQVANELKDHEALDKKEKITEVPPPERGAGLPPASSDTDRLEAQLSWPWIYGKPLTSFKSSISLAPRSLGGVFEVTDSITPDVFGTSLYVEDYPKKLGFPSFNNLPSFVDAVFDKAVDEAMRLDITPYDPGLKDSERKDPTVPNGSFIFHDIGFKILESMQEYAEDLYRLFHETLRNFVGVTVQAKSASDIQIQGNVNIEGPNNRAFTTASIFAMEGEVPDLSLMLGYNVFFSPYRIQVGVADRIMRHFTQETMMGRMTVKTPVHDLDWASAVNFTYAAGHSFRFWARNIMHCPDTPFNANPDPANELVFGNTLLIAAYVDKVIKPICADVSFVCKSYELTSALSAMMVNRNEVNTTASKINLQDVVAKKFLKETFLPTLISAGFFTMRFDYVSDLNPVEIVDLLFLITYTADWQWSRPAWNSMRNSLCIGLFRLLLHGSITALSNNLINVAQCTFSGFGNGVAGLVQFNQYLADCIAALDSGRIGEYPLHDWMNTFMLGLVPPDGRLARNGRPINFTRVLAILYGSATATLWYTLLVYNITTGQGCRESHVEDVYSVQPNVKNNTVPTADLADVLSRSAGTFVGEYCQPDRTIRLPNGALHYVQYQSRTPNGAIAPVNLVDDIGAPIEDIGAPGLLAAAAVQSLIPAVDWAGQNLRFYCFRRVIDTAFQLVKANSASRRYKRDIEGIQSWCRYIQDKVQETTVAFNLGINNFLRSAGYRSDIYPGIPRASMVNYQSWFAKLPSYYAPYTLMSCTSMIMLASAADRLGGIASPDVLTMVKAAWANDNAVAALCSCLYLTNVRYYNTAIPAGGNGMEDIMTRWNVIHPEFSKRFRFDKSKQLFEKLCGPSSLVSFFYNLIQMDGETVIEVMRIPVFFDGTVNVASPGVRNLNQVPSVDRRIWNDGYVTGAGNARDNFIGRAPLAWSRQTVGGITVYYHPLIIKVGIGMNRVSTALENLDAGVVKRAFGIVSTYVKVNNLQRNIGVLVDQDTNVVPGAGNAGPNPIALLGYAGDDRGAAPPVTFTFGLSKRALNGAPDDPNFNLFHLTAYNQLRPILLQCELAGSNPRFAIHTPSTMLFVHTDEYVDDKYRHNQPFKWSKQPAVNIDATLDYGVGLIERFVRFRSPNMVYSDPTNIALFPDFVSMGRITNRADLPIEVMYLPAPSNFKLFRTLTPDEWLQMIVTSNTAN